MYGEAGYDIIIEIVSIKRIWQMKRRLFLSLTALVPVFILLGPLGMARQVEKDPGQKVSHLEKKLPSVSGAKKVELLLQLSSEYRALDLETSVRYGEQALTVARGLGLRQQEAGAHQSVGIGHAYGGKHQKAMEHFQESREIYLELDDKAEVGRALINIGNSHRLLNRPGKALGSFLEASQFCKEAGDKKLWALSLNNLGNMHQYFHNHPKGLQYHIDALKIREKLGGKMDIAQSLSNIANGYLKNEKPREALEYYQKTLDIVRELGHRGVLSTVLICVGSTYHELEDYPQAMDYYQQGLKLARETGDKNNEAYCLDNMAKILMQGKDFSGALAYQRQALDIGKELDNKVRIGEAFIGMAEANLNLKRYAPVPGYLEEGLKAAEEVDAVKVKVEAFNLFSSFYEETGDYRSALEYQKMFYELEKKISAEERRKQFDRLQISYGVEKKAREIEVLKKNTEIQQLKLSRANFRTYVFIGGFALVLTILLLLFKKYLYLFAFWKKHKYAGQYRLVDRIGSGAMGTVFKAQSLLNKSETAAVKVLKEELFTDESSKKRFKREALIIDKLEHPHVIRIIERGEYDGQLFIAMEFLEGKTLADRIVETGPMKVDTCLHILLQATEALAFIHGKNIIHRDLKPANIMLISHGGDPDYVKLLDFGLAKMEFQTHLTQSGNFVGTIEYIAPEQILHGDSSPANDIFSLGVCAYLMLCGRTPFPGSTVIEIMRRIINDVPPPISGCREGVPEGLDRLIMEMLSKEPSRRPTAESINQKLTQPDW